MLIRVFLAVGAGEYENAFNRSVYSVHNCASELLFESGKRMDFPMNRDENEQRKVLVPVASSVLQRFLGASFSESGIACMDEFFVSISFRDSFPRSNSSYRASQIVLKSLVG